jgi:HTH-type transcriptional regulator / antitoxin HigA
MTENGPINILLQKALLGSSKDLNLVELLENKLSEYNLTKSKVYALLNIDKDSFEAIITGAAKQPNLISVLKIAQFLELDLNDFIPAILRNQTSHNFGSIEKANEASFIAKSFDIKSLKKVGFFGESTDSVELSKRITTFFGFENVFEYDNEITDHLPSKSKRTFSDKMKAFWAKSAYRCFQAIENPNNFDREELKELIIKIKPYCQDPEQGLLTVCKALYNVGVTVIVQKHLTTTQVRGGTFIVDGKPCIVLTDLFKRYTTIWETLIHELHHVLYDLDTVESTKYHLSGDDDLFLIEEKANEFSREYFCGLEYFKFIKPHINNPFIITKYAKDWEIHPSFIYSSFRFYQEALHGKQYYGAYNEYFPDYYLAIRDLHPLTWRENSIAEVAEKLKQIFEINS